VIASVIRKGELAGAGHDLLQFVSIQALRNCGMSRAFGVMPCTYGFCR